MHIYFINEQYNVKTFLTEYITHSFIYYWHCSLFIKWSKDELDMYAGHNGEYQDSLLSILIFDFYIMQFSQCIFFIFTSFNSLVINSTTKTKRIYLKNRTIRKLKINMHNSVSIFWCSSWWLCRYQVFIKYFINFSHLSLLTIDYTIDKASARKTARVLISYVWR